MNRVIVITPADARFGFSLTGVVQQIAAPEEAETVVRQAIADPDCGVVVIDERLVAAIGDERFGEMEQRWFGILLVLPAPARELIGEDYAERLIRRVIGYQVRVTP